MCDTFVAMPSVTAENSIIFGKNSDREPNEAQSLEYHHAQIYPPGKKQQCTYIRVPQVIETHGILIGRPFWMWGAEIGANDQGVVIGNEAVWTKMPIARKDVLTGMDILRLALERSADAQNAIETIVQLISDHGQGGLCGYRDRKMSYHNSYIIADKKEAWVLESAAHLWVAKQIDNYYSISNGLTIGEEYDLSHPDLISTAQKHNWLKKGDTFNFSKVYSDWFYTTFSACKARRDFSLASISSRENHFNIKEAMELLRSHGKEHYHPDSHFLGNSVCAHAANNVSRNATQSTNSFVVENTKDMSTIWATGTSAPCLSTFKPFRIGAKKHIHISPPPGKHYNLESIWWQHEALHRSVLKDYQVRKAIFEKERDNLENEFIEKVSSEKGNIQAISRYALDMSREKTEKWIKMVQGNKISPKNRKYYRRYWKKMNRRAKIEII